MNASCSFTTSSSLLYCIVPFLLSFLSSLCSLLAQVPCGFRLSPGEPGLAHTVDGLDGEAGGAVAGASAEAADGVRGVGLHLGFRGAPQGRGAMVLHTSDGVANPGSTPAPITPGVKVPCLAWPGLELLLPRALLGPEVVKFVILWKVFWMRALSWAHILRIVCLM